MSSGRESLQAGFVPRLLFAYVRVQSAYVITEDIPVDKNPSCLQAVSALVDPHMLSHTVPHVAL